ncbi:hypothetical protein CF319_g6441 [Tilletia indica]|nr:hypothetical protein CF319_g6441 [Tilletia indica]
MSFLRHVQELHVSQRRLAVELLTAQARLQEALDIAAAHICAPPRSYGALLNDLRTQNRQDDVVACAADSSPAIAPVISATQYLGVGFGTQRSTAAFRWRLLDRDRLRHSGSAFRCRLVPSVSGSSSAPYHVLIGPITVCSSISPVGYCILDLSTFAWVAFLSRIIVCGNLGTDLGTKVRICATRIDNDFSCNINIGSSVFALSSSFGTNLGTASEDIITAIRLAF